MEVDWLNISPLTGGTGQTEIYGYVTENTRIGCTRRATVRFTNTAGDTADLYLTQTSNTEDMRFVVTPDYILVSPTGGTYNVYIFSNTFWRVTEYDTGLTITTDNPDGYGDGILQIVFPQNPNTNNEEGTDHNGNPFYGRRGEIIVQSLMGERTILWEQPSYGAITVTPDSLLFSQTGGTLSATVHSDTDWTVVSYDEDNVSLNILSGHSGDTVIWVTKAPLTSTQIQYYSTKPSKVVFSDGLNTAILSLDSNLDDYYIDDDWITVYYNVPSANTEVILYGYESALTITPTVWFQDDNHTSVVRTSYPTAQYQEYRYQFYTTFTTPGEHIVKYKFNKSGTIIPRYGFPVAFTGTRGMACYNKIVIGNRCSGNIEACAAKGAFQEVILGRGDIGMIGEAAFMDCGSTSKDFILGNNVREFLWQPFHNFKARRFVYNRTVLGSTTPTYKSQTPYSGIRYLEISGSTSSWSSDQKVYASAFGCNWGDTEEKHQYIGDVQCEQLVIGECVETIGGTPFYPFYVRSWRGSGSTAERQKLYYGYYYATTTFANQSTSRIKGWTVPSIALLSRVSPTVLNYGFTPAVQYFTVNESTYRIFRIGTERTIPLHYPIGSDYSAWESGGWTNLIEDLDI